MGLLPAGLLAEVKTFRPKVQMYLDLGPLPDGTTWRLSTHPESGATGGPGDARVLRWGTFKKALDPFTADPVPLELNIDISDEGFEGGSELRRFARLAAKYPRSLRRTPAVLTIEGGGATFALFTGILVGYSQTGAFRWALKFRTDDGAINQESGASVPKPSIAAYHKNVHDDVRSYFVPAVMGEHDSSGSGNKGFVPCFLADSSQNRYVVSLGAVADVTAVYEDETVVTASDYTIVKETVQGALFTYIEFDAPREGEITADVSGLTDAEDGTGTLLTNAAGLKWWLVHLAYGDWRGGDYLDDSSAPINVASVTALDTKLARHDHAGGGWIGGAAQTKAAEYLRAWLDSHGASAYWRNDGDLALGMLDPIPPSDIYAISYHFEASVDEQGAWETPNDESNIAREISAKYVRSAASGDYLQTLRCMDVTVPEKVVLPIELPNASSKVA